MKSGKRQTTINFHAANIKKDVLLKSKRKSKLSKDMGQSLGKKKDSIPSTLQDPIKVNDVDELNSSNLVPNQICTRSKSKSPIKIQKPIVMGGLDKTAKKPKSLSLIGVPKKLICGKNKSVCKNSKKTLLALQSEDKCSVNIDNRTENIIKNRKVNKKTYQTISNLTIHNLSHEVKNSSGLETVNSANESLNHQALDNDDSDSNGSQASTDSPVRSFPVGGKGGKLSAFKIENRVKILKLKKSRNVSICQKNVVKNINLSIDELNSENNQGQSVSKNSKSNMSSKLFKDNSRSRKKRKIGQSRESTRKTSENARNVLEKEKYAKVLDEKLNKISPKMVFDPVTKSLDSIQPDELVETILYNNFQQDSNSLIESHKNSPPKKIEISESKIYFEDENEKGSINIKNPNLELFNCYDNNSVNVSKSGALNMSFDFLFSDPDMSNYLQNELQFEQSLNDSSEVIDNINTNDLKFDSVLSCNQEGVIDRFAIPVDMSVIQAAYNHYVIRMSLNEHPSKCPSPNIGVPICSNNNVNYYVEQNCFKNNSFQFKGSAEKVLNDSSICSNSPCKQSKFSTDASMLTSHAFSNIGSECNSCDSNYNTAVNVNNNELLNERAKELVSKTSQKKRKRKICIWSGRKRRKCKTVRKNSTTIFNQNILPEVSNPINLIEKSSANDKQLSSMKSIKTTKPGEFNNSPGSPALINSDIQCVVMKNKSETICNENILPAVSSLNEQSNMDEIQYSIEKSPFKSTKSEEYKYSFDSHTETNINILLNDPKPSRQSKSVMNLNLNDTINDDELCSQALLETFNYNQTIPQYDAKILSSDKTIDILNSFMPDIFNGSLDFDQDVFENLNGSDYKNLCNKANAKQTEIPESLPCFNVAFSNESSNAMPFTSFQNTKLMDNDQNAELTRENSDEIVKLSNSDNQTRLLLSCSSPICSDMLSNNNIASTCESVLNTFGNTSVCDNMLNNNDKSLACNNMLSSIGENLTFDNMLSNINTKVSSHIDTSNRPCQIQTQCDFTTVLDNELSLAANSEKTISKQKVSSGEFSLNQESGSSPLKHYNHILGDTILIKNENSSTNKKKQKNSYKKIYPIDCKSLTEKPADLIEELELKKETFSLNRKVDSTKENFKITFNAEKDDSKDLNFKKLNLKCVNLAKNLDEKIKLDFSSESLKNLDIKLMTDGIRRKVTQDFKNEISNNDFKISSANNKEERENYIKGNKHNQSNNFEDKLIVEKKKKTVLIDNLLKSSFDTCKMESIKSTKESINVKNEKKISKTKIKEDNKGTTTSRKSGSQLKKEDILSLPFKSVVDKENPNTALSELNENSNMKCKIGKKINSRRLSESEVLKYCNKAYQPTKKKKFSSEKLIIKKEKDDQPISDTNRMIDYSKNNISNEESCYTNSSKNNKRDSDSITKPLNDNYKKNSPIPKSLDSKFEISTSPKNKKFKMPEIPLGNCLISDKALPELPLSTKENSSENYGQFEDDILILDYEAESEIDVESVKDISFTGLHEIRKLDSSCGREIKQANFVPPFKDYWSKPCVKLEPFIETNTFCDVDSAENGIFFNQTVTDTCEKKTTSRECLSEDSDTDCEQSFKRQKTLKSTSHLRLETGGTETNRMRDMSHEVWKTPNHN